MKALSQGQLATDLLKMSWALSFERVKATYVSLTTTTWRNAASQRRMAQLAKPLAASPSAERSLNGGWIFGDPSSSVADLDDTAQVNYAVVGAVSDPLDDFYGAVGRGELKVAVFGRVEKKADGLRLTVNKLGIYLRDTYDFNGDQWLGLWSENGVDKGRLAEAWGMYLGSSPPIPIDPRSNGDTNAEFAVTNKEFRAYRAKYGRGGDFINVSDVRMTTLPQPASFDFS